jgi:hypothetical protein
MTPFSITQSKHRYRIVGLKSQRAALSISAWAACREAALFGMPSGALLALPVALRVGGPPSLSFLVWLAAAGLLGLMTAFCAGLLRVARPLPTAVTFVPLGLVYAAGPLTFLGTLIHAHTHHRPLGAATFAVLSLGITLLCFAFAGRTQSALNSGDRSKRVFGQVLLYGGALLSLGLGLRGFLALLSVAKTHPAYLASVLDGLLGLSVSLVGGFLRCPAKVEHVARIAGPLAMVICALALTVALNFPGTSEALRHSCALWAILKPK